MADLAALLLASLNPDSRKQAERDLNALGLQHGFLSHLLHLVLDPAQDRPVRLSGSIYLKNITKHRWEEVSFLRFSPLNSSPRFQEDQPLSLHDKAALRSEVVPAMLVLSNPADKAIRAQVAEAVSLIAELDFPTKWPDLIDVRINYLPLLLPSFSFCFSNWSYLFHQLITISTLACFKLHIPSSVNGVPMSDLTVFSQKSTSFSQNSCQLSSSSSDKPLLFCLQTPVRTLHSQLHPPTMLC